MEEGSQMGLSTMLHSATQLLLIPTIIILVILTIYALYAVGSALVELISERSKFKASVPDLIEKVNECEYEELPGIIDRSGLIEKQRKALLKLASLLYLPSDMADDAAKRLIGDENLRYQKRIAYTDVVSKIAPMIGLMGTLIPLGPGIVALGNGDSQALSSALLIAFDTTITGLVVSVICMVITRIRQRWYKDYLISSESVMNAFLDKALNTREENQTVPRIAGEQK